MRTNQRRIGLAEAKARAATTAREKRHARRIIGLWNAMNAKHPDNLPFFPTIAAARIAGFPWLQFCCPACDQVSELDLCKIYRRPESTVASLLPELTCRCQPNPAVPKLLGLSKLSIREI